MPIEKIQVRIWTLPELLHGMGEFFQKLDTDEKLTQAALQAIEFPATIAAKIMMSENLNASDIKSQSFSEIFPKYGINIFLLSGHRKLLTQKFEKEFGRMDGHFLLEQFGFSTLKRFNDAAILSDEKFEDVQKIYLQETRNKFDAVEFAELYFDLLPALKWDQFSWESMLSGENETILSPFSHAELRKRLNREYPDANALAEKFTTSQLNTLLNDGILTQDQWDRASTLLSKMPA